MSQDSSGKKGKLTSLEKKWVLYDVANSAFTLMVSTLIPIYFHQLAESENVAETDYLAYWGYAVTISTIAVILLGPVLGAISDKKDKKKPVFLATIILGAIGCFAMGFVSHWIAFIIVFMLAKIFYQISLIIYDSTLNDVTDESRVDEVSSQGYAWGYIGSVIPFIVCLIIFIVGSKNEVFAGPGKILSFAIVALWWFLVSMPLIKAYRQKHYVGDASGNKSDTNSDSNSEPEIHENILRQLGGTLKEMAKNKQILFFVIAFFFYIDGVYTIIDMSTAYGTALGLNTVSLLLALLVTQFVAFPSAITFGKLSKKYSSKTLISVCIVAYFCVAMFAIFMTTQVHFWILAVGVGLFQGGIQALSRSYFTKIIPPERSGEFFSFLDICGKGASILGTFLVSLISQFTGNQRIGIAPIAVFFIIGMILFRLSCSYGDKRDVA
ncbi:MAG: MFS transporter [Eubacterium sp.]|nr:MFS transporter [Eubacterium sp.]